MIIMSGKTRWETPLSGLVVTLSRDEATAQSTLAQIKNHPAVTVGELQKNYLPVALENTDARPIHEWLESLPGVLQADVVFVSTETLNKKELQLY